MKVSDELREAFRRLSTLRELAPKTSVLEQGEVSRHTYYVESGCLRMWHTSDGSDASVKFFLPGELCGSLESFYHETPSDYGIEAIVPTIIRRLTKHDIKKEMDRSEGFRDYVSSVMVHCMKDYQQLFLERISKTPIDRYRALVDEEPEIVSIVPLHYIASFLGITPVSLSRIRAKVDVS